MKNKNIINNGRFIKGQIPWNKGKHPSMVTINKLRLANLGKKASEQTRIKMNNSHLGKKHTEESKKKISNNNGMFKEGIAEKHRLVILNSKKYKESIKNPERGIKISNATKGKAKMFPSLEKRKEHAERIRI